MVGAVANSVSTSTILVIDAGTILTVEVPTSIFAVWVSVRENRPSPHTLISPISTSVKVLP
jgi:hypothetical protein